MSIHGRIAILVERVKSLKLRTAILFILLFGCLERLFLWQFYGPATYNDSATYWRLAGLIEQGWNYYDGTRVPVYPAFLAWVGSDAWVYALQLGMGLLITLGYFYIAWCITGQVWFATVVAMAHQLNLGQLFFEANILTETMATFWLVLAITGLVHGIKMPAARQPWLAFLVGIASALALLTRPLFILLPPWLGFWMAMTWLTEPGTAFALVRSWNSLGVWGKWLLGALRRGWLLGVAFGLPAVGLPLGWVFFIHHQFGDWALSTMTGFHLVQHTGAFFEYVPDRYAVLRDTYLAYRDARIAQYGTQTNTIWEAIPAMSAASGLSFYDLSRTLARISLDLIRQHPFLYLRSVITGWWLFWRAPVYWSADALRVPEPALLWFTAGLEGAIFFQRMLLLAANGLFLISPLLLATQRRLLFNCSNAEIASPAILMSIPVGLVWLVSILQTFLDHGDNPRFLVPMQSIVVMWALWWLVYGKFWRGVAYGVRHCRIKFQRS